jgi:Family of unknown function (DUF6522)
VAERIMTAITFEAGAVVVTAAVIGDGLGVEPSAVQALMRANSLTSLCEVGVDADAGHHRLTFFYRNRRLRLVVDAAGRIINRSTIDFGDRPMPPSVRRAGA